MYEDSGPLVVDAASGVLAGDTTGCGVRAQVVTNPNSGTLILDSNGSFVYTPNANFAGTDSFTFKLVSDLGGESTTATATIRVGE